VEFYHFKRQDAFDFASFINARTKIKGDELVFSVCPYCHGESKNNREKFAINLNSGAFNCLRATCNAKGSFWQLAKEFGFPIPDADEYYGYETKKYRTFKVEHIESRDAAVRYCESRGISEKVCRKYELTVQKEHENILVFPFRDHNGIVQYIKYRKTDFNPEKDSNKEWSEKDGKAILFGMFQCDMSVDTLVLTEGQIDSLSVATAGISNAVSVPTGCKGKTWIPHCWDFVNKFKYLIVFGDNEHGEITLVDMVRDRFPNTLVKVVRSEDYGGCKDANEILQTYGTEAVKKAVENAETLSSKSIRDVSNVEDVDILSLPALRTGITKLDEVLTRGLYFGQVILLTGNRGDGKSTFMQQLICNAVDKGVKTFLYSGELPNYVIRNFCKTMWAGKHESEVSDALKQTIFEYYRGRLFLYDSTDINSTDESEGLLQIAEQAIIQYGCRLVCLDNLMTVVEAASSDALNRVQSQFVGKLTKIAKQHNVIVILVAHPRKRVGGDVKAGFTNDDVSGSADITNKVDVVMSYQRCKARKDEEPDDSERELWITKNRLTGKLAMGDNAILLKYENGTRRITGAEQSFTGEPFNYKWFTALDKPKETVPPDWKPTQYDDEEIPF